MITSYGSYLAGSAGHGKTDTAELWVVASASWVEASTSWGCGLVNIPALQIFEN